MPLAALLTLLQQAAKIPEEPPGKENKTGSALLFVTVQLNGIYTTALSVNEPASDLLQLLQLCGLRGVSGGFDEHWNG